MTDTYTDRATDAGHDSDEASEADEPRQELAMTDDQIVAYIANREVRAERLEISAEQADAMDYYLRRPFGDEEEGRSQVISSDVWDVVEGLVPMIIEPFVSSSDLVVFNATGPEDEEAAKQETDAVNYDITQRNDAFTQFLAWVKAGLLQKNGVVTWYWDETHRTSISTYRGVTEDVLASFLADPEVQIIGLSKNAPEPAEPDLSMQPVAAAAQQAMQPAGPGLAPTAGGAPQDPQQPAAAGPPEVTYDVRLRERRKEGVPRFEVVPPEELLVIGRDPNIQKSRFVQWRTRRTLSDLREMGYDVPDDISDGGMGDASNSDTYVARAQEQNLLNAGADDGLGDPAMREVWFRVSYCYLDLDGDGIAELRKICLVGSNVLDTDETDEIPFASWTPYLQLFEYDGRCPADEAIEFQDIKSTLWRQALDNLYTVNNNRVFAGPDVNLDDLLDNQIAGVVRSTGKAPMRDQVMGLPIQPLGAIIQPMIEYADESKENRTGFSRYNQGSSDLGNQKTLGEVQIVSGASNKRTALMIRCLAEQGMKPLMLGMHGLRLKHAMRAETMRLRGKWVTVDPRDWMRRFDMTVSVGTGTMDKQTELATQQEILKMQAGVAAAGIVTPENQYNAAAKFVELTGEKNADRYFTHPDKVPPKPAPDPMQNPEVMLKVAEQQLQTHKQAFEIFKGERELAQKDRELDQVDRELDQVDQKQGIDATNAQLDALERQHRLQLETEKHVRDMRAPHPQALAAGDQALQADQQQHDQQVDQQQLAQGQQSIDIQANPPAPPAAGDTDGQA